MAEYALATLFVSVPDALFFKRTTRESGATRYPNDIVGSSFRNPLAYTRYVVLLLGRPLTSSYILLSNKIAATLVWLRALWLYKRKIIQEFLNLLVRSKNH